MSHSFPKRGLHLDLRVQVMPMAALRAQVRDMARMNFNVLLVEWEATFPYQEHAIISNQYAYTPAEIADFVGYCGQLGVEVIPLQQCFSHIEYILRLERYAHLREDEMDLCQLCPSQAPEALEVFGGILREVAAAHPSAYLHIGGDEAYLLGHCAKCSATVDRRGKSGLYVDYIKQVAALVVRLGKRPMLWADMLLKHPEAANELPRECVFFDWNYGWPTNRFGDLAKLAKHGFEFWGAAALRSNFDSHSFTDWHKHFKNLQDYVPYCRARGFQGIILTSWSTSGAYGYEWEKPGEMIEKYPIRRVYPHAGFRILQAAFWAAIEREAFSPQEFVVQYAAERFGLAADPGRRLWSALKENSTVEDVTIDLPPLLRKSARAKRCLGELRPQKNQVEFAHLRLMADLRDHHLRFKRVERRVHSKAFHGRHIAAVLPQLRALLREARQLDVRYWHLLRGNLYPNEFPTELDYRSKKLRQLYARLARAGRSGKS